MRSRRCLLETWNPSRAAGVSPSPPVDGRAAMRWYVSIGAVLVAGVLAGGDVAGVAAPSPKNQLGNQSGPAPVRQLAERDPSVDVELVLAVDVSYSMDM